MRYSSHATLNSKANLMCVPSIGTMDSIPSRPVFHESLICCNAVTSTDHLQKPLSCSNRCYNNYKTKKVLFRKQSTSKHTCHSFNNNLDYCTIYCTTVIYKPRDKLWCYKRHQRKRIVTFIILRMTVTATVGHHPKARLGALVPFTEVCLHNRAHSPVGKLS